MKMEFSRLRLGLTALAVGLGLAGPALADFKSGLLTPDTIVVGTTGSAPPFSMIDTAGKLDGYDIAVMNKIGAALGLKVEFKQLDWAGLLPGLVAKKFDVVSSGVTRTKERLASADMIMASPYIVNGVAVTKLASNDAITSWDGVCGKTVGVIRGAAEIEAITATLPANCLGKVKEYPGWTEMALDLKNHRIDWVGMDYLGPNYLAGKDTTIAVLPEMRAPKTQSIAIASGEPALAAAIDALLATWREDGTLNQIITAYFGTTVDFSALPAD